jgi:endonuclease/exonuclease/phosphatase family metal-dependent hydrolase
MPVRLSAIPDDGGESATGPQRLRLLSYNIQAGVETQRYRQYFTQSWKQWLPHRERQTNLKRIASLLAGYDLVGLQEVDSGSLRSGFVDQTEYLAQFAGFPFWYKQVNRNLGRFAQYSNGVLSRLRPSAIIEHKLPGAPGRGAIFVQFGPSPGGLAVCVMHLSLGRRARRRQLAYVGELAGEFEHLVLMGDLNCDCESKPLRQLIDRLGLREPTYGLKTFPSWRPRRNLDHILVSSSLAVERLRVLNDAFSDHLPVSMEILLPRTLRLGG